MIPDVWAPRATRVALRAPARGEDTPMTRGAGGWWRGQVEVTDGEEYGFVIDDALVARPDPRSRRQPRGVHELSAVF
ncbi:MAG: malto-oligosyltrehalose trehalohydrolase, partial [Microbacterium sp.]|nr:malto-oligosyltrehalose trehalohydrolase [Microbacterium sp.]